MTENPDTKISVVIPTYNRSKTIGRATKSAQDQTYPVSEIIIVDDSSTDDTIQVAESIDDDRIRYYFLEQNKGAAGARNYGVSQAKYDIIAFLDSDDAWRKEKMEKQMAYMTSHKNCRFVYSAFVRHYSTSDQIIPEMDTGRKLEGDILSELLYDNTVSTQTIVMTKDLFEEAGGFDENLRSLEDWDLAIRCSKLGPIGFVPEVLVDAPYLDDSLTSNMDAYFRSRCQMIKKHRQDYLETDTFNLAAGSILALAQEFNMLDSVQTMLLQYIST